MFLMLIILILFLVLVGLFQEGFTVINWAKSPSLIQQFNDIGPRNFPEVGYQEKYPSYLFPGYKYLKYKRAFSCPKETKQ